MEIKLELSGFSEDQVSFVRDELNLVRNKVSSVRSEFLGSV
jgi:hypothetical protein